MFVFKKEQIVNDFAGVQIGGQPGENPTVLIGGLFFKGQPIMEDTREGVFDKQMAKDWIDTAVALSETTGHPFIIQAFGRTGVAMERHISWLVENFDGPFMFESSRAEARIRGIQHCEEIGVQDRAIFNSINMSMKNDEKEILSSSSIDLAVVLGWSPRATSLVERMEMVQKMISESKGLGINRVVVDPGTMPVGAGFGLENRTMLAIKSELGLPTCLGPHNAPSSWRFLKQDGFDDESNHLSAVIAATVAAQLFATDCIMYGSMIRSKEVFTAVSLIGNAIAVAAAEANNALGVNRGLFVPPTSD